MKKEQGEVLRKRMARLVKQWRASGRPATRFADAHGITRAKFEYWKTRLGVPRRCRGDKPASAFVPVRLVEPASVGDAVCEIVLAGGDRLLIRAGTPLELARGLLAALRGSC